MTVTDAHVRGEGYVEHFPIAYDRFWAPYPRRQGQAWLRFFDSVAAADRSLLDVGCGTGIVAQLFLDAGYRVVALDVSAAMLARAEQRLAGYGDRVRLLRADATDFEITADDRPAFALSTYDVPNHLRGDDPLAGYLRSVHRAVAPGALFGFEMATRRLLTAEVQPRVRDEPEALVAMWRGEIDEQARQLPFHLCGAVRAADGRYDRFSTVMINTWYPVAEVLATLAGTGWTGCHVAALADPGRPIDDPEEQDRVAFVARKPA